MSEELIRWYRELADNTTQLYCPEHELSDIVWETLGAYFAGDRTIPSDCSRAGWGCISTA